MPSKIAQGLGAMISSNSTARRAFVKGKAIHDCQLRSNLMESPRRSHGGTEGPAKCPAFGSVSMSMVWVTTCLSSTISLAGLHTRAM